MELSGKINRHIPSRSGKFDARNYNENHAGDSSFDGEIEIKDRNFNGDRQLNREEVGDYVMNSSRTYMDDLSEIEIEKREIFMEEGRRSNSNSSTKNEAKQLEQRLETEVIDFSEAICNLEPEAICNFEPGSNQRRKFFDMIQTTRGGEDRMEKAKCRTSHQHFRCQSLSN
ncbi:uncharacterized protein LOC122084012 [Macadamia integrifolia]|uniref:uncharacterized protein LOC122084012 n=1 Tax=Macadamia integrifolia TaxID=60698 RepID=UPI001C4E7E3E|nr:uncharacterized protein LOC122084012 [Macadamia integrifolia]